MASKNPLEDYLREMRRTHDSGGAVAETSYYPHLLDLLNAIGAQLKPKARCILNPANRGASIPDLGLYTLDQYLKVPGKELPIGTLPSRGVVEASPPPPILSSHHVPDADFPFTVLTHRSFPIGTPSTFLAGKPRTYQRVRESRH